MNMKNSCPRGQLFLVRLKGLSHGLKTVHRTVFLTAFRVPCNTKKTDTRWVSVSLVRLKGLEPTRLATREPKGDVTTVKVESGTLLMGII